MRNIALIHTVESVAASFGDSLRNYLGYEVKIHNLWDDLLVDNPNEVGEFAIQNHNCLLCDMKAQELTGVNIIVATYSTLTPAVELTRPFIRVPVIAIGDAMARGSVLYGKHTMAMAIAESTVGLIVSKIKTEADRAGREADIPICVCMDAPRTMKAMDMKKHDVTLREKARGLKGYDCIVLAQASMVHLEDGATSVTGYPILTSPRLCVEEVKNRLGETQG